MPEPRVSSDKLRQIGAAFVTLKKHGQLRGCIGHIIGSIPLNQCVQQVALSAALEDPRFNRVVPSELPELQFEISVLTPVEIIKDLESITVGRDGLIMESGYHRGVLLPQVPIEQGWDRQTFLQHTCRKAGMHTDCWKDEKVKVSRFQALVFH